MHEGLLQAAGYEILHHCLGSNSIFDPWRNHGLLASSTAFLWGSFGRCYTVCVHVSPRIEGSSRYKSETSDRPTCSPGEPCRLLYGFAGKPKRDNLVDRAG